MMIFALFFSYYFVFQVVTPIEQSFQHLANAPTSFNLIRFTMEMSKLAKELPFEEAKAGLIKSMTNILHDEKFEKIRGDEAMLKLLELLAKCSTKIGGTEVYNQAYGIGLFNKYKEFYFQWAHECGKMKAVSEFRTVFHLARSQLYFQMPPTSIESDFEKIFQQYFGKLSMHHCLERTETLNKLFAGCSIEEIASAENNMSFGNSRKLSGKSVNVRSNHRVLEVARETMNSSDISPNKNTSSVLLDGSPSTIWPPSDSLELPRSIQMRKCERESVKADTFSMSGQSFDDRSFAKSKGMIAQNLAISTTVGSQKDILHREPVKGNSVLEASTCSTPKKDTSIVDFGTYIKNQVHQTSSTMRNSRRRKLAATVTSTESPMKQPRMTTGIFSDRASTIFGGTKH
ncbi:Serine/threonine-protein kinase ATR [Caenorhabditis elegans]|uniref:Serine/threonine-protein kinase ATR n=1 Tax=Caenorhabditis elegans TaxID=6239 RepID=G5EEW4_CAEEL|nr:Serine/threonine-protein kinase ATR [Caenorhabditis elegans]CAA93745.1 Serine/threonine-protein kinase ATR [Caenorhabditis elegans]|eukprot:NP_510467.1 Uncharacterized protein CELE_C27C12.3 [Caenorhabditis elegans]